MSKYLFQTSEFGISDNGIHLLRSGFEYETIKWRHVNSIKIEKGKELHNWWIIFLLGTALISVGVYLSIRTIDVLIHLEHPGRSMLMFLFIPCVGVYFVYNSLRTGIVLKINHASNKREMFPLRGIIKANRLNEFKSFVMSPKGNHEKTSP